MSSIQKKERQSTVIERLVQEIDDLKAKIEKCDNDLYFSASQPTESNRKRSAEARTCLLNEKKQYEERMKEIQSRVRQLRWESVKTAILALIITTVILLALHYYQWIDLNQFFGPSVENVSGPQTQDEMIREMMRRQQAEIAKGPQWMNE